MLNHEDNNEEVKKMVLFCIAAASCVLLVFLLLISRFKEKPVADKVEVNKEEALENTDDVVVGKNSFISDDLDFWDMYGDTTRKVHGDEEPDIKDNKKPSDTLEKISEEAQPDDDIGDESEQADDDYDRSRFLRVYDEDGKAHSYKINKELPMHNYDFESCLQMENGELTYNSKDVTVKKGIDVSKNQGTIDFSKLKESGIDFLMVKVAGRGYESGNITIDEKFVEYIQGAQAAGIPAGLYFNSQAVNDVEAIEEANYAVAASLNYSVSYPIAIYLDNAAAQNSRTDKLDNTDRTFVVQNFCDTVKSYGKQPIICAPRDYLISKLNLEDLYEYDIWIRDVIDDKDNIKLSGPDFPYRFSMWQYSENGSVDGINGKVNTNFYFSDNAER